jgi:predicted PurR-regulated permease PerM
MSNARTSRSPTLHPVHDERSRTGIQIERWGVLLLAFGAALALAPLWAPILLAGWCAVIAAPLQARWVGVAHGRAPAAAAVTVLLTLLVLIPLAFTGIVLWAAALQLLNTLQTSTGTADALKRLVSDGSAPMQSLQSLQSYNWETILPLLQRHAGGLASAASSVFGAATTAGIGVFVFVAGFYSFLVHGKRGYAWLIEHSPIPRGHLMRFADAYVETGRGLLIGVGLTGVAQGLVATLGYVALDVPQALVLGLLTTILSLIPLLGSAFVWVPVSVGLYLSDRSGAAVAMLVIGSFVSVIDNLMRPYLARWAQLQLNGFLVLAAMLGGTAAFGPFGILLGPLLVRLTVEGFRILSATNPTRVREPMPRARRK